ncbi:hypothetical protein ACWDE0_30445 [Streptomyces sp. 900105755]
MGEQVGDGLDDVAHVLAAAEVAGQRPPVLRTGNAVLDPDTSRGVRLASALVDLFGLRRPRHPTLTKTAGSPITPDEVGPVDVVLLSHDEHADNLDMTAATFSGPGPPSPVSSFSSSALPSE